MQVTNTYKNTSVQSIEKATAAIITIKNTGGKMIANANILQAVVLYSEKVIGYHMFTNAKKNLTETNKDNNHNTVNKISIINIPSI